MLTIASNTEMPDNIPVEICLPAVIALEILPPAISSTIFGMTVISSMARFVKIIADFVVNSVIFFLDKMKATNIEPIEERIIKAFLTNELMANSCCGRSSIPITKAKFKSPNIIRTGIVINEQTSTDTI